MQMIFRNSMPKLFSFCMAMLLSSSAQAFISMPEREHAQTIVWIVEGVTFVTAFGIAILVWKISKKDRKTKSSGSTPTQVK